ncbi:MAG TPA: DUF1552 domain-containing protein [Candidatus Acidoferrales bacterium]|nr:DUF1552 domain-containing protein [Candidatus Acidoferrales bacterium]
MPNRRKSSGNRISRRAVLRGAGVTMALPWLGSLPAFADATRPGSFPKRFAVLFMGNGVNEDHWDSEGSGAGMTLSKTLEPLEPLKGKINVIHGLFQKRAVGLGIHPAQTGSLLSGSTIQKGAIIRAGITVDQAIANHVGQETAQPSIVLACEQPMTGYHETNYSMAYSSHVSWQTPDSPVPNEVYPSLAWDSLFENRGSLRNMSILDRVKEDAAALCRQISSDDKAKLDEYLTSVREVEKRIEGTRKSKDQAEDLAKQKNRPVFSMDRPANGLPEDLREHARLMCDIIAIAFQTDKTRVATLLLARDLSAMYYPFLEVREGHHAASHNNQSDGYERIARFHLSQLAYLAAKLDSMAEGDGTVLDHSCLMWLSNMWIGRKHDNTRLPLVLAGGLSGTLKTGRTMNYVEAGDDNRKLCSLFLSIMDRMGIKLDQFGDAETRLERI